MDRTSILIEKRIVFGAYPDTSALKSLQKYGITVLVDLTGAREIKKADRYSTNFDYIKYSIRDCRSPTDIVVFDMFISDLIKRYESGENIYIHCRGGHGRAGLVSIILLKKIQNIGVDASIKHVNDIHSKRKTISPKMLKMGVPQTIIQKKFIQDYFSDDIYFYDKNRIYYEFSNFYLIKIEIDGLVYPSVEHYYQAQKFTHDLSPPYTKYVKIISEQTTPGKAYYLAKQIKRYQYKWMKKLNDIIDKYYHVKVNPNWETKKMSVMRKGLEVKFKDSKLKKLLTNTSGRKIFEDSPRDYFWGIGKNKKGRNELGNLLVKIRDTL